MYSPLYALLLGGAPWALGAVMLYGLLYQRGCWRLEHHLFIIGSSAYLGYLWIAVLMTGLQHYMVPVFSSWLPAWMALSIVMCLGLGTFGRVKVTKTSVFTQPEAACPDIKHQGPWILIVGLSAWLVVLIVIVFWEVALRPAMAWDTLTFWADNGSNFLHGQLATDNLTAMSSRIHPVFIKYVGAWGGFALYERSASGLYLPWAALYFGTILACMAAGRLLCGHWGLGLIAALVMASSSVIQAQASLGGYADLWLGTGLFLSLAWLAATDRRAFQPRALMALVTGILICSLALIKGNAIAYLILLLGAMFFAWAWAKWHWAAVSVLTGTSVLSLLWIWNNGLDWTFLGYSLTFLPEEGLIALGQRRAPLANNSWAEIGRNFWYAWGLNSTFYLAGVLGAIVYPLVLLNKAMRQDWTVLTGVFLLTGLILFFGLGQKLNEQQLFAFAIPESDTSLSRFTQVIYFAVAFTFLSLSSARTAKA